MDAVSTSGMFQSVLYNIQTEQQLLNVAATQSSSEVVGNDLQAYGSQAEQLVATNSLQSKVTSYITNNNLLSEKLSIQSQALQKVSDAAQSAASGISDAIANNSPTGLSTTLQAALSSAASALNTSYNGQYIFAGDATDTAPFTAANLSDLTTTSGGVTTGVDVSSVFANSSTATTSRLNDNTTTTTGFLASDIGTPLVTALQALQTYVSNTPLSSPLTSDQSTQLSTLETQFNAAVTAANATTAQNGVIQNQVTSNVTDLTEQQTALQGTASDITSVNLGQVATNLQLAQNALQASADVFTTLQSSSLLNLLSSSGSS
jgi:flagellar hook-associated protein 3 FlgL